MAAGAVPETDSERTEIMAAKKSAAKPDPTKKPADPNVLQVREGLEGIAKPMNESCLLYTSDAADE